MDQQHNVAQELHELVFQQVSNTAHAAYVLYTAAGAGRFLKHAIKSPIDFLLSRQPLVSIHLWTTGRRLPVSRAVVTF